MAPYPVFPDLGGASGPGKGKGGVQAAYRGKTGLEGGTGGLRAAQVGAEDLVPGKENG